MSFRCTNELEHFSFQDCVIGKAEWAEDGLVLTVDALIVMPRNSQNTQFTESYADTAEMKFQGLTSFSMKKEGYRYYDADDNLIEEVPDVAIDENEAKKLMKVSSGAFLFRAEQDGKTVTLEMEFADPEDQDPLATVSYELSITCADVMISWERYLNRVQH